MPLLSQLLAQLLYLAILSIPVACIAWTVAHEELLREPRELCRRRGENAPTAAARKFYYLFTCEYCFSHYLAVFFALFADFRLLLADWRGYILSIFSLVWVANVYMGIYNRLRVDIRSGRAEADIKEHTKDQITQNRAGPDPRA